MKKRSLGAIFIGNVHLVDRGRIPIYMYTMHILRRKIIIFVRICWVKQRKYQFSDKSLSLFLSIH